MAITFVNAGTKGTATSGTTLTLGAPASPQTNDIWIAVAFGIASSHSFTDWTNLVNSTSGGATTSIWYFRYAGTTPNLNITLGSATTGSIGGIASFRGVKTSGSPANPVGTVSNATSATIAHTAITPGVANSTLLVINVALDDNNRTALGGDYAVAFQDGAPINCYKDSAGTTDVSVSLSYDLLVPASTTGTINQTQAASDPYGSVLIALTPAGGATLTADAGSYLFSGQIVGLDLALVAAAGSYLFSGQTVVLRQGLVAAAGSYAFSGQTATVRHDWKLPAAAGAYAFTGQTVALRQGLIAEAGSYVFTGTAVTLRHVWRVVAEAGAYAFTGTAATLRHSWRVVAEAGAYLFSGQSVSLTSHANKSLLVDGGSYSFTGSDVSFRHAWKLSAGAGSYSFTGQNVSLRLGLVAAAGSYSFTGSAATIKHGWRISAAAGAYLFTGTDAAITTFAAKILLAGVGSYSFTGSAATIRHDWRVVADAGAYAFTGSAVTLTITTAAAAELLGGGFMPFGSMPWGGTPTVVAAATTLTADAGIYSFAGQAATIRHGWKVAAGAGSYAFTGQAVTLRHAWRLPAGAGSYLFTGQNVSLRQGLVAQAGSYSFSGQPVTLRHAWRLIAGAGSYSFTGQPVTLRHGWRLTAAPGSYAFTGQDVTLRHGWHVTADVGSYLFTGSDAFITVAGAFFLPAGAGSYLFTGSDVNFIYVPAVVVSRPADGHWDWDYGPVRGRVRATIAAKETTLRDRVCIELDLGILGTVTAFEGTDLATVVGDLSNHGSVRSFELQADTFVTAQGKVLSVVMERRGGRISAFHFNLVENQMTIRSYEHSIDSVVIEYRDKVDPSDDEAEIRRAILMMALTDG